MNSSWEQNATAANDSGDWGGWGSGVGATSKPADQDNSWEVHAKVQDNSTYWGGFASNVGDGIGRPNAKSNAGSSWGEKDKMECCACRELTRYCSMERDS